MKRLRSLSSSPSSPSIFRAFLCDSIVSLIAVDLSTQSRTSFAEAAAEESSDGVYGIVFRHNDGYEDNNDEGLPLLGRNESFSPLSLLSPTLTLTQSLSLSHTCTHTRTHTYKQRRRRRSQKRRCPWDSRNLLRAERVKPRAPSPATSLCMKVDCGQLFSVRHCRASCTRRTSATLTAITSQELIYVSSSYFS